METTPGPLSTVLCQLDELREVGIVIVDGSNIDIRNEIRAWQAEITRLRQEKAELLEVAEYTLNALKTLTTELYARGHDKPVRDKLEAAIKAAQ